MKKNMLALLVCIICLALLPTTVIADDETKYEVAFYTVEGMLYYPPNRETQPLLITAGETIGDAAPTKPTLDNKCFQGWKDLDTGVVFDVNNNSVDKDLTLVAIWGDTHTFGDWQTTEEATCSENGTRVHTCIYCGFRVEEEIEASHDIEKVEAQRPTCTENGHTEYYKCKNCDKLFSNQEGTNEITESTTILEKLGHNLVDVPEKTPTCNEPGWEAYKKCDREGCNYTEFYQIKEATGEHTWVEVEEEQYLKTPATGSNRAEYYRSCSVCGTTSTTEWFYGKDTSKCNHQFNGNTCENCGVKRATVKINITGNGIGVVNNAMVQSGKEISVAAGTVSIDLKAGANAYLAEIMVDEEPHDVSSVPFTFTAVLGEPCVVITAVFTELPEDATPGLRSAVEVPEAATTAFYNKQAELAEVVGASTDEVFMTVRDYKPYWNSDVRFPMTNEEVAENQGITIVMPYPDEIPETDRSKYKFSIYHFNSTGLTLLNSTVTAAGVSAKVMDFSPFALFATPIVNSSSGAASGQSTDMDKPITKTKPEPPKIRVVRIIDEGSTQTGAILDVDSSMEYMRKDSSEGYKKITGTTLEDLAAGTYYVRYRETTTSEVSEATTAKIEEFYTVRMKLIKGKGRYEVTSDNEKYSDDIYLVRKNEDIGLKFTPEKHYWLYKIEVNDNPIEAKSLFTLSNVRKKTTISYGFSDSSSSPKTGDNNDITLWVTEEIVSLLGMTAITWYLFRRKET